MLIVCGVCGKDVSEQHTVAINFCLDDTGVIFEGCQESKEPRTKAFYLTESTGRLLLERPQAIFIYYPRPGIADPIEPIPRKRGRKRKL